MQGISKPGSGPENAPRPPTKETRRKSPEIPHGSTKPSTHLSHGTGDWNGASGGDGPNFSGPMSPPVVVGGQSERRR
jgi:hypothetical protein